MCWTSNVLSHNWSENKSLDWGFAKTPWLQKVMSNERIRAHEYPRKGVIHVFKVPFIV